LPRATHIHTVVLPPVHCSGHSLSFFCDLKRELALEELLATLDLWLDWSEGAVAQKSTLTEDEAYELATQDMRAPHCTARGRLPPALLAPGGHGAVQAPAVPRSFASLS